MRGIFKQRIPNWYDCANPDVFQYTSTEELLSRQSVNWCEKLENFIRYGIRKIADEHMLVAVLSGEKNRDFYPLGNLAGDIPQDIPSYVSEWDITLQSFRRH